MKKDILFPNVEGVKVAIAKEVNEFNETIWNTYLINSLSKNLTGVMVSARGYGELNGEVVKTATVRYFIGELAEQSQRLIEPIDAGIFRINNEYWVSYFIDSQLFEIGRAHVGTPVT